MTTDIDVPGYLRRLGLGRLAGQAPSVAGLHELHRAHAERIPYECLEIWLGRPTTVDPAESVARILRGRGGYCYHLNGAISALLLALGYRVTRHVGGVQNTAERPAGASANHLVLTVSGLPGSDRWLVDLGMGDGLHEPLPLAEGDYRQGPFRYALRPSEAEPGGWRFDHDPGRSGRVLRGAGRRLRAHPRRRHPGRAVRALAPPGRRPREVAHPAHRPWHLTVGSATVSGP